MTGLLAMATEPAATGPGAAVAFGTGLLAAVLVLALRPVVGHASVAAHEGGHALTTVLLGRQVQHVVLNVDRTGVTQSLGLGYLRRLAVLPAGYLGPSVFGLGAALLLAHGHPELVLGGSAFLLAALLLVSGNWFGRLVIVVIGGLLVLAVTRGPDLQAAAACTWAWLLLLGGVADLVEDGAGGSDHAVLRKHTWLPASVFSGLFLILALAALVYGGGVLTGIVSAPG